MNLQQQRIEALCEQLKMACLAAEWPALAQQAAREEARVAILPPLENRIVATDNNAKSLELARNHAIGSGSRT